MLVLLDEVEGNRARWSGIERIKHDEVELDVVELDPRKTAALTHQNNITQPMERALRPNQPVFGGCAGGNRRRWCWISLRARREAGGERHSVALSKTNRKRSPVGDARAAKRPGIWRAAPAGIAGKGDATAQCPGTRLPYAVPPP